MPKEINPSPAPQKRLEDTREEFDRVLRLLWHTTNALRSSFARLLQVSDERKPQIYQEVFRNAEPVDLNYWLEICFSIGIATLGLIMNSTAVVIGAMLISPLMGPIIASGLAVALGDFYLGIRALVNVVLSTLGSIFVAALITWVLPFRSATEQILERVQPTLLDLGVALFSGAIGALVVCRGGMGGGVTALPGVAVAVALMPPLGVIGFGVGAGWQWQIISGGGLLYLTNLVGIVFAAFLVFFAVRLDTLAVRRQINEWLEEQEKGERLYDAIQRTPLRRLMGKVGTLPRRVLTLLLFLAMVAFPLGRTLLRLRDEANIHRVVADEIGKTIPRGDIVSQQLDASDAGVRVRVVAVLPEGISPDARRQLEDKISARTGKPAQVIIHDVATREEGQAPGRGAGAATVPLDNVDAARSRLLSRIRVALAVAWPANRAPLAGYWLRLDPQSNAMTVHLAYLAELELGALGEEAVQRMLRDRLGTPALEAAFERVVPAAEIPFAAGSALLGAEAQRRADGVVADLRRFAGLRCAVEVPAEAPGESETLRQGRAEALRRYLLETGKVAGEKVEVAAAPQNVTTWRLRLLPPPQP